MNPEVTHVDGWHFAANTLRDGTPLPKAWDVLPPLTGTTPCTAGMYHLSVRAIDALFYAPGAYVARVRLSRHLVEHGTDKFAGQVRENLTDYVDSTSTLRAFARWSALRVIHLWNPEQIVIDWLHTGDESLRQRALASARESAWESAWASAQASAWASAWERARESARASALASARESARASALASARESARVSARASALASALAQVDTHLEEKLMGLYA